MSRLLAILAGGEASPPPAYTPPPFPLTAESQIIVDGNSISAGHGGATNLANLLKERMGVSAASVAINSGAANGETWRDMITDANYWTPPLDAIRDPNRPYLAVVANETTNSIRTGTSVEQTKLDIAEYWQGIRDRWPYAVCISWPALPTGHADPTTYPDDPDWNAAIIEVNGWMESNLKTLGIHHWIDVRKAHPQFNHDGLSAAAFTAYQQGWQEAPPTQGDWPKFGWLHPTVGAWPSGRDYTTGHGKRVIAAMLADQFLDGKIRASA